MFKTYPYLINTLKDNENIITKKMLFLSKLDTYVNKKQYVRITLLTWQELAIKEIEGKLTGGNMNKDGSSSVRRNCSLTATIGKEEYDIENANMDFSMNKKIFVEIGIKNETDQYSEYPILWFPQGVFYISSFSLSSSATSSIAISLSLKDKMAGLNGEAGGVFPTATQLDEVDDISETGLDIVKKVKVYDLIQELVNHWGGEPLENIVIENIPDRINRVMKWNGDEPLYISQTGSSSELYNYDVLLQSEWEEKGRPTGYTSYEAGSDVGYVLEDFVYSEELSVNAGETVVSALDKIKNYLGNFEYFYDEYGIFHFREIKNYLNTKRGSVLLEDMSEKDYLVDANNNKGVYTFSNNSNIISLTVNPQYSNIKNDFVVNGVRKSTKDNISAIVKYHLVIDTKPSTGNSYKKLIIYTNPSTEERLAAFPVEVDTLPEIGNTSIVYSVYDISSNQYEFYKWDSSDVGTYTQITPDADYVNNDEFYITEDYRTDIYLQELLNRNNGISNVPEWFNAYIVSNDGTLYDSQGNKFSYVNTSIYGEELVSFWPSIYDILYHDFLPNAAYNGNYYLDFIDPAKSGMGEFSIQNIGRRTSVTTDEKINCLFAPTPPDIYFLCLDDEDIDEKRSEYQSMGYSYSQVRSYIYSNLSTGGLKVDAYSQIVSDLWTHSNYQKSLSITALPMYYLEPNICVDINDNSTHTKGVYTIKSISLPFAVGTMSLSANESFSKI